MSGPKRTMFPGGHYQIGSVEVPVIHNYNTRIDFEKYPDAREQIYDVYRNYEARRREQRNSAGCKELGVILETLRKDCFSARLRLFEPWKGLSGQEALQVNGALTEVLMEDGLGPGYLHLALEEADRSLRAVEDRLVIVGAASEKFVTKGGVVITDEKLLRENFIRGVYEVLVQHGLNSKTTSKSPITLVVIELEGTKKSDDEQYEHQRTVSAAIRAIVKPQKGG